MSKFNLTIHNIMNDEDDCLIGLHDIDKIDGIQCARTIQRLHSVGKGPARIKLGRKVYYRKHALREWIISQEYKKH